ncbi:hypothetical protein ACSTID_24055, partial [Vibrio parahaemolyticus]
APSSTVVCVLMLNSASLPASTLQTFIAGNSTATAVSTGSIGFVSAFPGAGISGVSNYNYSIGVQCSYGGNGPWFSPSNTY